MSQINVNNIRAKDGVSAVGFPGGINATGVVTATSFLGNLTGNVTGNVTGNLTGNVTGNLTGNVTGNTSGTGVANIVTGESMLTVDDSVTVTVEDGKTVVPDLFDVFG